MDRDGRSLMNGSDDNLDDLLADLCDGSISQADFAVLERRLTSDAESRRRYVRYMHLHAELAFSDGAISALGEQALMMDAAQAAWCAAEPVRLAHMPRALGSRRPALRRLKYAAAAAVLLGLGLIMFINRGETERDRALATITPAADARLRIDGEPGNVIDTGATVEVESGSAKLAFRSGPHVTLSGRSSLRLDAANRATLHRGTLAASVPAAAIGFTIDTPTMRIIDLGTRFGVLAPPSGDAEVHVFEGSVEVQPRVRLPRLYYSFDDGEVIDAFAKLAATARGGARATPGIIGAGAMQFDNDDASSIVLGDGGASEPGHGIFGVRDGITIEVIIIPRWSGKGWSTRAPGSNGRPYDYDEIFRKDDGDHRILLCFQDDEGGNQPLVPVVDPGPCLTFGLHLQGHGYSELDMRLDGQHGRPTLAELKDGKPHHVVATYDAATGIKAIYIDGTLRFSHRFTPGGRIVAGGAAMAAIGNNLSERYEAFQGVIDEFAFYDAALTPGEIAAHWRHVKAGLNYFGVKALSAGADGAVRPVIRLSAGDAMRFDADSGLPVEGVAVDEAKFGPR